MQGCGMVDIPFFPKEIPCFRAWPRKILTTFLTRERRRYQVAQTATSTTGTARDV